MASLSWILFAVCVLLNFVPGETISGSIIETCTEGRYDIQVYLDSTTSGTPNCTCPDWIGSDCCQALENVNNQRPVCDPACENGGVCIAGSVCSCQTGFLGTYCQITSNFSDSLNPTLPLDEVFKPLSWYDGPAMSLSNRVCFIKATVQNAPAEVLFTAESTKNGNNSYVFGNFVSVARDVDGVQFGVVKYTCLQVRCPGETVDGEMFDVDVAITVQPSTGTCSVTSFQSDDVKRTVPSDPTESVHVTLEAGLNYGSRYGVYVATGYLSKAMYVGQQLCYAGDDYDIPSIDPARGAAMVYTCS